MILGFILLGAWASFVAGMIARRHFRIYWPMRWERAWCRMLCRLGAHSKPRKIEMGGGDFEYDGPRVYRIVCGECGDWLANAHDDTTADRTDGSTLQ